jgi:phosphomannomutase
MSGSPQVRNVGEPSDWWFNLRPSNTEPVLRLNVEADDESLMIEKRDALLAQIGGC